jgi:hypothetical protein
VPLRLSTPCLQPRRSSLRISGTSPHSGGTSRLGFEERQAGLETAKRDHASALSEAKVYGDVPNGDPLTSWPGLSIQHKRRLLGAYFDEVRARQGRAPSLSASGSFETEQRSPPDELARNSCAPDSAASGASPWAVCYRWKWRDDLLRLVGALGHQVRTGRRGSRSRNGCHSWLEQANDDRIDLRAHTVGLERLSDASPLRLKGGKAADVCIGGDVLSVGRELNKLLMPVVPCVVEWDR